MGGLRHNKGMAESFPHPGTTLRLYADPAHPEQTEAAIEQAAAILRRGGTVAFATETVYGLGANALDPAAIEKIFVAKRRPSWDPLIVHVADAAMLAVVAAQVPEPARLWINRFWPGPLTLLLPRTAAILDAVTAGRPRVGVRMPRHPAALALIRAAATPIAAPSANLFGHVSPTTAAHVLADLDGRIDAVLDGGSSEHGLESTVVDCCENPCILYRPGAITLEELAAVWPHVVLHQLPAAQEVDPSDGNEAGVLADQEALHDALQEADQESLPSPGFGLRHYAPRARLVLVEHGAAQAEALLRALLPCETPAGNQAAGLLLPHRLLTEGQLRRIPPGTVVQAWGQWGREDELAHALFAGLRALDDAAVATIVCPLPPDAGLGMALCDRLRKAARPR